MLPRLADPPRWRPGQPRVSTWDPVPGTGWTVLARRMTSVAVEAVRRRRRARGAAVDGTAHKEAESPGYPADAQGYLLTDAVHQLRSQIQLLAIRLERLTQHISPAGMGVHGRLTADVERLSGTLDEMLDLDSARTGG